MKATLFTLVTCISLLGLPAYSQDVEKIKAKLDSFEQKLDFSGVVLIAKGDSILLSQGYGYANSGRTNKIDKNTVFQIASVTKAFTAAAIVQLAEKGKLSLQDPLSKYFTNVPAESAATTIHQLLIHYSGLPQTYAAEGQHKADKAAKEIFKVKLQAKPGSQFIYSNGNYAVLAIIIEKITGGRWEDYIRTNILKPLALSQTYFWEESNPTGFPEIKPKGKPVKRKRDYGFLGSSGIFCTAADLQKFLRGLNNGSLFSDSSKALLFSKYVDLKSKFPNSTDYYSYGLFQTAGEVNCFWVRGNEEFWGVSIGYLFPASDISVIVLSDQQALSNGEKPHMYVSRQIIDVLMLR